MNKLWICFGLIAVFGVIGYAEDAPFFAEPDYEYYGYEMENDYPNSNVEEAEKKVQPDNTELKDIVDDSGEIMYDDEYEEAIKMPNNSISRDLNDEINKVGNQEKDIDDYQIEDNRSEVKEDKNVFGELVHKDIDIKYIDEELTGPNEMDEESDEEIENDEDIKDSELIDDPSKILEDLNNDDQKSLEESFDDNSQNIADDVVVDDDTLLKVEMKEESKESNDEFEDNKSEENDVKFSEDVFKDSEDSQKSNSDQHTDETKQILKEINESFEDESAEQSMSSSTSASLEDIDLKEEENSYESSQTESSTSTEKNNLDEDTVDQAYSDLKDDVNHLRDTLLKFRDDVTDANINKDDLPGFDELDTKLADMAQEVQDKDDYEVIDDKDLFKLFKDLPDEDLDHEILWDDIQDKESDEYEETDQISDLLNSDDAGERKSGNSKVIKYVDDALNANEFQEINDTNIKSSTTTVSKITIQKEALQEHQVEPLEDVPYAEFDITSANELQKTSADPIRITLNLDTPVVLTSPNYPSPYPANAVIDWVLEGEGRGIEFNVTDFALNSNAGDYVMIKPGRVDASGNDGILLSHILNRPRAFRFLDVNRMFIRFDSRLGLNRFRGFSFSVKLIDPLPEERVLDPEAQPIGYPHSTITLNLGGVTLEEFLRIEEDFRQIVADMATMYIEVNQIDPGRNTTLEVTQITSRALCFHNWPQFEHCAEVVFGVPLQYEDEESEPRLNEEQLRDMWFTYSNQNPFALRLHRLGIEEFQIPNDNNVLMVWLVIAAGVVISMAMLAFALWRFSCFEDYTRMPSFSDTESVNEKKNLDLYPTPHQTLPPLYSDTEYKWGDGKYDDATRVDMSGFSNRSYVRTEDYDFDSEEEVAVHARDRYTTDV